MNWFSHLDSTGYELQRLLPGDCIDDCAASGDVIEAVEFWVKQLKFDAPADGAREYLRACGAWTDEELADHEANLRRLLWQVACDEHERYTAEG